MEKIQKMLKLRFTLLPLILLSILLSNNTEALAKMSINGKWCTTGKTTFFLYEYDHTPTIPKPNQWCFTFDTTHSYKKTGVGRFSFKFYNLNKKIQKAALKQIHQKTTISHDIGVFSYLTLNHQTQFILVDTMDESICRLKLIQPNQLKGLIEEVNHNQQSKEAFAGVLDLHKVSNTVPKNFLKDWYSIHNAELKEHSHTQK